MESKLATYEGQTFSSSYRGLRFVQIRRYTTWLSVLILILLSNVFPQLEAGLADTPYFALALLIFLTFAHGGTAREVLRSIVTVVARGLEVESGDDVSRIDWEDILYIHVDRSVSGHRRKVYIRARGGRLFTLLDPERGEELEHWAREVALPAGVKLRIRERFYLTNEPVWIFLSCCIQLALVKLAIVLGLL